MKKQLLITFTTLAFLIAGTVLIVLYGMGYRFSFNTGKPELAGTGLLVATSLPDGASVYINGHLTTATDNTINLSPGSYEVRIEKDGYFPWKKTLKIKQEEVSKAEALLFPITPRLESITVNGVINPVMDPSLSRLVYTTASQSARKNGVFVLDMTDRPILTLQSASVQLADDTIDIFSQSALSWTPDAKTIIATSSARTTTYLLKTDGLNQNPQDITTTLSTLELAWQKEQSQKEKARVISLKKPLQQLISDHFSILAWSPDDTKILYEASSSATLPIVIKPRIIGIDATPEKRTIEQGKVYLYDIKEDKNYKIDDADLSKDKLVFMPDSKHLVFVHNKTIDIIESDGSNRTTVFAGPFLDNYVFPWSNTSKVVILTDLGNKNTPPNLYTIGLK